MFNQKSIKKAFTLTELLIVIILVGILASLAIPRFGKATDQAMELEATLALEHIYQLQNVYFLKNRRYTTNLDALGFDQEELIDEEGEGRARYEIEVQAASQDGYTVRAIPALQGLRAYTMDENGKILIAN
jgi:type IV pilus assembly protein PilE